MTMIGQVAWVLLRVWLSLVHLLAAHEMLMTRNPSPGPKPKSNSKPEILEKK
jgi:hypothetical protein